MRRKTFVFFTAVVVIQGIHMFEHVVQLVQVSVLGVPDDEALGLLGYVLQLQGTEEWLHIAFNGALLVCLYALVRPVRSALGGRVSIGLGVFLVGVSLETSHFMEHVVIISNVIANDGCPCPGVTDRALGVSDTVLHFFYNLVVYACMLVAFRYVARATRSQAASEIRVGAPPASAAG